MEKELIKLRFTKSLKTYRENAIVQKQMAENLSKMITPKTFNNILELGCGTGFLTEQIYHNFHYKNYDTVDMVDGCKNYIKKISDNINFICADIENFVPEKKYDLIISNATLQWLENLPDYINKISKYLNKNGIFAFTLFGKNHFKEMNLFLKNNLKYYSLEDIRIICSGYTIKNITEQSIKQEFNTPKDVLYHIKKTGVNALSKSSWTISDYKKFNEEYKNYCDNNISLTYHPLYVILSK